MSAHSRGAYRSLPLPEPFKPTEKDMLIYELGSLGSFRCVDCGSNVFRQVDQGRFSCNGCGTEYMESLCD